MQPVLDPSQWGLAKGACKPKGDASHYNTDIVADIVVGTHDATAPFKGQRIVSTSLLAFSVVDWRLLW